MESDRLVIEMLLYSLAFKDSKSADLFCYHWTKDVVHGRFLYQGKEFVVPELPQGHQFVADIEQNTNPVTMKDFPVQVNILVAKKGME